MLDRSIFKKIFNFFKPSFFIFYINNVNLKLIFYHSTAAADS